MNILSGKKVARQHLEHIKKEVEKLNFQPVFCDVLVGEDPVSEQYVRMKEKRAEDVGMLIKKARFPRNVTTEELVDEIKKLNQIPHMCGLIVQLPLPEHIDQGQVLDALDPEIDVDVLNSKNENLFYNDQSPLIFPTARSVMALLDQVPDDLSQKKFLVIGQGKLVGKPVTHLLKQKKYHVDFLTRDSDEKEKSILNADVIISATGQDRMIRGDMIKEGVVLIDAGTSESHGGIFGDVDSETLENHNGFLAPVPGGVGPVTVAMLLDNVLRVAQKKMIQ